MYIYNFVSAVKCGFIVEKDTFLLYSVVNGGRKVVKPLNLLSARELEALYIRRQRDRSANCSALIAAGRGMERGNEIYAKGKANADRLSVEYVVFTEAVQLVISEMEARKRWHGSLKPIKRCW